MKRLLFIAASAISLLASPAAAQNLVINNATLATGDGSEPVRDGQVIVLDGEVVHAGPERVSMVPPGTPVINADGAWVTPGIFASVTTIGIWDVGAVSESNDIRAGGSPFSAALDVELAVNPNNQHVMIHRAAGITRAATATTPSGSIFGGQGAIIDLDADGNPITRARAFQLVDLGQGGARLAGGSRASSYVLFKKALYEAQQLRGKTGTPQTTEIVKDDEVLLGRFDAEALIPVLNGTQKLFVEVERAQDIRAAIALGKEFPRIDMVLVGASEGWMVANEIAAAGIPVLADPLDALPYGFDQLASTQSNIGRMKAAGVKVGINAAGMENPRRIAQQAGNLVGLAKVPGANGLSWGEAFASISSIPADIAGMGGKAGVLAAGALGDVVVWSGDPLEVTSVPTRVYIGGVEQPLGNHQTRLRDRYRDLDETDLPKAYDW